MAWFVLVVSGVLEAVWAVALSRSGGFSRLWPSTLFVVWGMALGDETVSALKLVFLAAIIGGVVGLKLAH